MNFREALYLVIGLLYVERRVTLRRLRKEFDLDEETLEDVRNELVVGQRLATEEDGEVLVWGDGAVGATRAEAEPLSPSPTPGATGNPPATPSEAERRQLTVMFCDLVGSTALSTRLDAEDLRDVIAAFQEACRAAIHRYDGFIARYMGDGMLVYFGYPQAHEQDAERAVRAGLDILRAIPELSADVGARHGVDVAVRIGVATGPVVVGDIVGEGAAEEAAVHGETPNLAARIQGIGEPNQLVVSDGTRRLVAALFDLQDLGTRALKGIDEPVALWQVLGEQDEDAHVETDRSARAVPLVGRQEELGLLTRSWEASRGGHGQVVLLQGEAGIGKSRLIDALREQIAGDDQLTVVVRCSPYHANSSLYPVIEHLKRAMGWKPADGPEARLEKLETALARQSLPLEEVVPLYADLFSLSLPEGRYEPSTLEPRRRREATLDALVGWLLDEAERQPVLQVFEDLHWADPTTLELVELYIEQSPTVAMLNVLTYRPEFAPPWPMRSHMTPITLNRLERPEVETLIGNQAGGKALPSDMVEHIAAKADGVPLYVEELTKTILESGYLHEEADRFTLKGSLSELMIPATLQDSLMARLDRIPTVREVAQIGAVIGREFAYEMLRSLAPLDEPVLQNGLGQLVSNELLYQRGRPPRARYIFKHALIHDAAYQSLLRRTRQQYHQRVAELLLERFPETVEANPEILAHHYTEAGEHGQAIAQWLKAGKRARAQWANQEAIAHLEAGLRIVQKLPDSPDRASRELELQLALGSAIVMTRSHTVAEAGVTFRRARELCTRVGDASALLLALLGLWRFHVARSELDEAQGVAGELLRLAGEDGDAVPFVIANYTAGFTALSKCDLPRARHHLEGAIDRYEPSQRQADAYRAAQDPGVACRSFVSVVEWLEGYPDKARARSKDAVALAESCDDFFSLGYAHAIAAIVFEMLGDDAESKMHARATVDLSEKKGFSMWIAFGGVSLNWMLFNEQADESTLEALRESLSTMRALGIRAYVPYFETRMAKAYQQVGQKKEALEVLAGTRDLIAQTGERWWEPEVYRLEGECLLSGSPDAAAAARACFDKALEIARERQTRSLELRAAMSLGELLDGQGDTHQAIELLAPVHDWFKRGSDTADLARAGALLDAWHARIERAADDSHS